MNARAQAQTAYRVRVARLATGDAGEESAEAAAGALLEAEMAHNLFVIAKAHSKQ